MTTPVKECVMVSVAERNTNMFFYVMALLGVAFGLFCVAYVLQRVIMWCIMRGDQRRVAQRRHLNVVRDNGWIER